MAVDDFFYDNKLFPYLDYEYTAKTIGGVLNFEIDLYTQEAKDLSSHVRQLKISITDDALHIAVLQLNAELQHNLAATGEETVNWNAVREELLTIESKPWQNIEEVDIIDLHASKLVPGSFYTPQDKTAVTVREASVTFALDEEFAKEHRELLPLHCELSELMSENVRADLYSRFGFYSAGTTRNDDGLTLELTHTFHILHLDPTKLSSIREAVEDSIIDLYKLEVFQRLTAQLHNANHSDPDKIFPGVNHIFKQTNLIVGEKGWKRIATKDNCKMLLSHMKLSISAGQSSTSLDVASLLDIK